jgi:hypothetical protein
MGKAALVEAPEQLIKALSRKPSCHRNPASFELVGTSGLSTGEVADIRKGRFG